MNPAQRRFVTVVVAVAVFWLPRSALAHGIGGRQDLPVPVEFFIAGAAVVLVVTFVALSVLWPSPRLQETPKPRTFRGPWIGPLFWLGGLLGVASLVLVILTGLFGAPNPTRNPTPVIVFVAFWLVVPFVSGLVGDIYPIIDPWRRLARWSGADPATNRGRKGYAYIPAAVAFFGFTWLELVAPDAGPRNLAIAAVAYTVYLLAAAAISGVSSMSTSFDAFATYNHLLGSIGPVRFQSGAVAWRGWLRGLPHLEERRGLVAFVVLMIGTVTFDGMSGSLWWEETITTWSRSNLSAWFGLSRATVDVLTGTLAMVLVVGAIGAGYWLACRIAAGHGRSGQTTGLVARRFAHTLVPIAFAYAVAHYFSLIVFEGQFLLSTISDPFGFGWDLFGTANRPINYTFISPSAVWYSQVAVIVAGHVGGVVLAHDRALVDFPPATAVRSQFAMLVLMVVLTGLGLSILAAG
ncbi:MAG: fenitrothion hydrolase [Acidimicrobiia bacterium]